MSEVICVENDAKVDARCHSHKIDTYFLKCKKIDAKEEKEKEEREEKEEKEEVRSNALLYTYRLRGWWRRRPEYMREATNAAKENLYQKNISSYIRVPNKNKAMPKNR